MLQKSVEATSCNKVLFVCMFSSWMLSLFTINMEFDTSQVIFHYFTHLCATVWAKPFYWSEFYCQGPHYSLTALLLQQKNSYTMFSQLTCLKKTGLTLWPAELVVTLPALKKTCVYFVEHFKAEHLSAGNSPNPCNRSLHTHIQTLVGFSAQSLQLQNLKLN